MCHSCRLNIVSAAKLKQCYEAGRRVKLPAAQMELTSSSNIVSGDSQPRQSSSRKNRSARKRPQLSPLEKTGVTPLHNLLRFEHLL